MRILRRLIPYLYICRWIKWQTNTYCLKSKIVVSQSRHTVEIIALAHRGIKNATYRPTPIGSTQQVFFSFLLFVFSFQFQLCFFYFDFHSCIIPFYYVFSSYITYTLIHDMPLLQKCLAKCFPIDPYNFSIGFFIYLY